ncbi:MAG: hypothetical protein KAZ88_09820 [Acidimicrobiia bacterium]|nr:hypothetical protein [Acidimicrobiia bacterium]
MKKKCDHNIPETKKRSGECQIQAEVKKRNGKPNWWCTTHGMDASAPDGTALLTCPGAWFDDQPAPTEHDAYASNGTFSVWGAIPAAFTYGDVPEEAGGVHVHERVDPASHKHVDASYDIVRVHGPNGTIVEVESMAARAYSISELAGQHVKVLTCPKPQCQFQHIDELKFATQPHVKHQCNRCGRNFWDQAPSVGNPLADAFERLNLKPPPAPVLVNRPLRLDRANFGGIALWPTNRAILTNLTCAEDQGIHVHAWDHDGDQVIDETYHPVVIDGEEIDEDALRLLALQRSLSHGAPILSQACETCGVSMISPHTGWIEPTTSHTCHRCGAAARTRKRSFLNPLADKEMPS